MFGAQSQAGGIFNKPTTSTSFGFGGGTAANAGFGEFMSIYNGILQGNILSMQYFMSTCLLISLLGTQNQGGLFGNKTGFGTGTNPLGGTTGGFGTNLGTGLGTGSSLFAGTSRPTLGGGLGTGFGTSTSKSLTVSTTTSTKTIASTTLVPSLWGKQREHTKTGHYNTMKVKNQVMRSN